MTTTTTGTTNKLQWSCERCNYQTLHPEEWQQHVDNTAHVGVVTTVAVCNTCNKAFTAQGAADHIAKGKCVKRQ